jgi:ribosome-associated toxin RatA of RatAB toxin-antitoxin module
MSRVNRSADVAYSAVQMFDLVNDVAAYPEFLHWCRAARIDQQNPGELIATVDIGLAGIHKSFTTRNRLEPPADGRPGRIEVELVAGPFRRLHGTWTFEDSQPTGSRVRLELEYEISLSPLSMIFSAVFEEVARTQMDAFIRRASTVYADG